MLRTMKRMVIQRFKYTMRKRKLSGYILLIVCCMGVGFLMAPFNYAKSEVLPDQPTAEPQVSPATDSDTLAKPVSAMTITSAFGPRNSGDHRGVDLGMPKGSPIYAADSGKVIISGSSESYGNYIKIDHGNGMITLYAHCDKRLVKKGQQVKKNQIIGKVGETGVATGPHLHFEVIASGKVVDPMNYL